MARCPEDLLTLAALLERAYRLALDVRDDLPSNASVSRQASVQLVELLDDARVLVLCASRRSRPDAMFPRGRSIRGG
jgi:hypothetical protein